MYKNENIEYRSVADADSATNEEVTVSIDKVDEPNLPKTDVNIPGSMNNGHAMTGWRSLLRFASDYEKLQKGYITPLRNRGLFVGEGSAQTTLPFTINRYDSVEQSSTLRKYSPELLESGGILYNAVGVFRGSQVTSTESGTGTVGAHWGNNKLSDSLTGINVVNGMSGSVGIRIRLDDIKEGEPIVITSGGLSGCTMIYAVDEENFYVVHTGQKPNDNDWKTGVHGVTSTKRTLNALSGKHLSETGEHNNDLIDVLSEFDKAAITYLGKDGTRVDNVRENVSAFDYNQVDHPGVRVGYSYALLARHKGKVNVKVLSEDVSINLTNMKMSVLDSMKIRLR